MKRSAYGWNCPGRIFFQKIVTFFASLKAVFKSNSFITQRLHNKEVLCKKKLSLLPAHSPSYACVIGVVDEHAAWVSVQKLSCFLIPKYFRIYELHIFNEPYSYHLKIASIAVCLSIWPTDRLVYLNAELRTGACEKTLKPFWFSSQEGKRQRKGPKIRQRQTQCNVCSGKGQGTDCGIVHGRLCSFVAPTDRHGNWKWHICDTAEFCVVNRFCC